MKKNVLSMLLILCLILAAFAGCGTKPTTAAESGSDEAAASVEAVPAESEDEAVTEETSEDTAEPGAAEETDDEEAPADSGVPDLTEQDAAMDYSGRIELLKSLHAELPISESGETLKLWIQYEPSNLQTAGLSDLIEQQTYQLSMERTGVNIDLTWVDINNGAEKFDLLVASGDWPDLANNGSYFSSGIEAAYEQEIVMDLTDLIPEFAPNYYAQIQSDKQLLNDVTATTGELLEFYVLRDQYSNPSGQGAFIRMDWLEDLGLEVPETYDDLETVLTAFKDEKGATEPLALYSSIVPENGTLIGGFGSNAVLASDTMSSIVDAFYQVDGEVIYGATADGTREYLSYLNKLNGQGLINFENMTKRDRNPFGDLNAAACANGQVGYMFNNQPFGGVYGGMSSDPNINWWPVPDVTRAAGDINPFFEEASLVYREGAFVFATSENAELACKWMDFWYTWEGYCLGCYGIEGTDFDFDETGFPVFRAERAAEFDTVNGAMIFCTWADFAMMADNLKGFSYDDRELACFPAWSSNRSSECMIGSKCTLNAEQSSKASSIYSDILTHVSTCSLQFINGDLDVNDDAVWNKYVADIEQMNIGELTQIVQDAYDAIYN